MAKVFTRREPVRLSFRDGEVMVTPKDQDVFFLSAEKATEACRVLIRQEERVARFTAEVLQPLAKWCEEHHGQISACYLLPPESAVLPVYVVGAREEYDFDLTRGLSDLALAFEERGWSVHASQIPRCEAEELRGFFDPDQALQVYG
jgi:hypothetical protein